MFSKLKNTYISFKTRILMGFISLILMMIVLVNVSLVQFSNAQQATAELNNVAIPHAIASEGMAVDVIQVQQFLTDVSATHDPEGYKDAEAAAIDMYKRIAQFRGYPELTQAQMDELSELETAFNAFYAQGKKMAATYIDHGIEAGNVIMEEFDISADLLTNRMRKFKDTTLTAQINTGNSISASANHATKTMLGVSAGIILASILIAIYLTRYLGQQLGIDPFYAKGIAKEIAKGNFSRQIIVEEGDTSSLLYAMKQMQESINDFVIAQGLMAQKHAEGWISEKIDADKFPGTYGKMAHEINQLVASHIAVKMRVVEVISEYARGNFSVDMDRLPGEKAKITASIDNVKQTLYEISKEIELLAEAGAKGDFSKRADASKFEYMFKDIINDFNILIDTCDTGFSDILSVTEAMAVGDMSKVIDKQYLGTFGQVIQGMNKSSENLKALVKDVKDSTDTINTAAKEIAAGNNDLSHRTEEQAASLEQTAASMKELTTTVQANAENANQANQLAQGASDIAGQGVVVINKVVNTMASINDSSRKIVDIISVIDGIAFQTNILALNAAVEAARAGEQGRGFAVVAGEVRNLAQRSAAAAGEIKGLIGDSVEKVEVGSQLVQQAGHTMEDIVKSIRNVASIMGEITSASTEQSNGIGQVNQAIDQMDDVTQQNAALVEQAAAAAESLEEQARNLSETVAKFKVDAYGNTPIKKPAIQTTSVKAGIKSFEKPQQSATDWEEF